MDNIGIICNDSIELVGHSLFLNFRMALEDYFNCKFKDIASTSDLTGINKLIIVDEHFTPNVNIWKNDQFIATVNAKNIKVLVFNFERIFSAQFPWNISHQQKLETFKHLQQLVSDVDDAIKLGKKVINKQFLSKKTILQASPVEKKQRILFIGQCNNYYPTRRSVINKAVSAGLPIDVIITDRKYSYSEFLNTLSSYRYVFNPLGTGKFLNLRFYEALKQGCIPIQEITPDMESWYGELSNAFKFIQPELIDQKMLFNFDPPPFNYYLEDYFKDINIGQYL